LLEFLVDRASFEVSRMVATTENTSDIIRAFRSVKVLCGVSTCAFDASWFEMAVVFCVSVSLAICAFSNIPFVLGSIKFDFALLEVFDKEYVLVVRGRFQLHKKHCRSRRITVFGTYQVALAFNWLHSRISMLEVKAVPQSCIP
jgi:hypothetical protein